VGKLVGLDSFLRSFDKYVDRGQKLNKMIIPLEGRSSETNRLRLFLVSSALTCGQNISSNVRYQSGEFHRKYNSHIFLQIPSFIMYCFYLVEL
jgi:hypothetical protein